MRRLRNGLFRYGVLVCLLIWCHAVWAGDSDGSKGLLSARFIPDSAPVGSMVELALAYRLPKGAQLPPEPGIKGLEGLVVENIRKDREEVRIRILVDRMGEFKAGPLSLAFLTPDGKTDVLHADPVALTVLSNLGERPEDAQIKPICGIIATGSVLKKGLFWGLVGLGACVGGLGLFLWLNRRRKKKGFAEVYDPPHIAAEKEIRELASQGVFEKGHVKEFYFRFSEILRRYLEALRGFPAAEYTTQEIALAIQDPEDRRILPLLQDADLVKFADLNPTPAKKSDEIEQALAYIRKTGAAFERDHDEHRVQGRGTFFGRGPAVRMEETRP